MIHFCSRKGMTPNTTAQNVAHRYLRATDRPRQLLDARLQQIADRARRLARKIRVRPHVPAHAIVGDVEKIVELAEGD